MQQQILDKDITVYAVDAGRVARDVGMAGRINIVLQTCFFAISGVLPREESIEKIKTSITKSYGKRGPEVVAKNHAAVDQSLEGLVQVEIPELASATRGMPALVPATAPDFVRNVTAR